MDRTDRHCTAECQARCRLDRSPEKSHRDVTSRPYAIRRPIAPGFFRRYFEPQTRQRIVCVRPNFIGQQVPILGVKDKKEPIQKDQRALTQFVEVRRIESAASLAVGSRERPAKLRKNAAKNSI